MVKRVRCVPMVDRVLRVSRFVELVFKDWDGSDWVPRDYQVASMDSVHPRKVHCDGRDVGKTTEIEIIAAWGAVSLRDSSMLVATQCENHLYPLMSRIVRRLESHPFGNSLVEIRRTPSWYLRFTNGFELWGRIAGRRGVNFQGMHVDWQLVDEAQALTDESWGELFQALNGGGTRWVYGVPNGRRNMFYRMTHMQDHEHHNWPSSINPAFTRAKDAELALLYGGRNSPGYIHRVLGQHGSPAFAVFELEDYLACVVEDLAFHDLRVREDDDFEAPGDVTAGVYYLGCDLGYARDPSEFVVFRVDEPYVENVLRVRLEGVNYARQQGIIKALDAVYAFRGIGIDAGNSGRAVAHALKSIDAVWCDKVRALDFGSVLELEPMPDGSVNRRRTKDFMTELVQRRMAERTIRFPRLPDREEEYAGHTYSVGTNGHVVYDKGHDHLIDADRCALLCHYLDTHVEARVGMVAVWPRVEVF